MQHDEKRWWCKCSVGKDQQHHRCRGSCSVGRKDQQQHGCRGICCTDVEDVGRRGLASAQVPVPYSQSDAQYGVLLEHSPH